MNQRLRYCGLLVTVTMVAASASAASQVYRCGPDGREYSQTPCKDGRAVDTDDSRNAEQQRDGRSVAEGQARLARQLEAQRRAREAAAAKQGPAGIKPPPPVEPASAPKTKKKRVKDDEAITNAHLPARKKTP